MTHQSQRSSRGRPRWRALLYLPVLLLAHVACGGDDDADVVSRARCERLRDHIVELRLASVTADRDQHAAALKQAVGVSLVESCLESTPSGLRCRLAATTHDALVACADE